VKAARVFVHVRLDLFGVSLAFRARPEGQFIIAPKFELNSKLATTTLEIVETFVQPFRMLAKWIHFIGLSRLASDFSVRFIRELSNASPSRPRGLPACQVQRPPWSSTYPLASLVSEYCLYWNRRPAWRAG
jgi:hypothetical protein